MTGGALQRRAARGLDAPAPVLAIRDLTVSFPSDAGMVHAVNGVDLDLHGGRTVALVGESGCGKTMTALASLGLVSSPGARISGSVCFDGVELMGLTDRRLRRFRGAGISMVFQDPVAALNPVLSISQQIAGVLQAHHRDMPRADASDRAVELLERVGISDAGARIGQYPHQWSGGMCQRAMIAMAIANDPKVVIADEPTTALDVTVQAQVLEVLREAQHDTGAAVLLITHDLGVVAELADVVAVMYAGRVVETATLEQLLTAPSHPYTRGLLGSVPSVEGQRVLAPIPGLPPQLHDIPSGCAFHPRCPVGRDRDRCRNELPVLKASPGARSGRSACHYSDELAPWVAASAVAGGAAAVTADPAVPTPARPVLEVDDLRVHFSLKGGGGLRRRAKAVRAVDGISLAVAEGDTLGLVGESGCGKSTAAHAIARLVDADGGSIRFNGVDLAGLGWRQLRQVRHGIQLVFQDPLGSVNPKMRIADIVAEPLRIHGVGRRQAWRRVVELLAMVGLDEVHADRLPHQFSGGQLQRVGIARALAMEPQLLVLDEPVSALDVSVQAQVLLLLQDLQQRLGLSYLFISHDLSVVRHVADRVAVMYLGRIVEEGPTHALFSAPRHPYTRALLDAVPRPEPMSAHRERIVLSGETPSAADPPSGCRFRTRCWLAQPRCAGEDPGLDEGGEQRVACHFPLSASGGSPQRPGRAS